jgi:hypothetical protein
MIRYKRREARNKFGGEKNKNKKGCLIEKVVGLLNAHTHR